MRNKPFLSRLFQAAAISPFVLAVQGAEAQNVTVTYPVGTLYDRINRLEKPEARSVDCKKLHRDPSGQLYITKEWAQQVDLNPALLKLNDPPANATPQDLRTYYGGLLFATVEHAAKYHPILVNGVDRPICGAVLGSFYQRKGQPLPDYLKPGWENDKFCPAQEAFNACKIELSK